MGEEENWSIWRRKWCPDGNQIFIFNMREITLVCILILKIQNREKNWWCRREEITGSWGIEKAREDRESYCCSLEKQSFICSHLIGRVKSQGGRNEDKGHVVGKEGKQIWENITNLTTAVWQTDCSVLQDSCGDAISEKLGSPHTVRNLFNGSQLPSENAG